MTEPLDLDALDRIQHDTFTEQHAWHALIAELRATRAERDKWKTFRDINLGRAERAEAELAEERQVAEGYASDVTHYQAAIAHAEAERDGNYNEMMTAYRIAEANLARAKAAEGAMREAQRAAEDFKESMLTARLERDEAKRAIARVEALARALIAELRATRAERDTAREVADLPPGHALSLHDALRRAERAEAERDALIAELEATRSREVQLRAMEGIQRTAKMEALTRAERAEAELAEERQVAEGDK